MAFTRIDVKANEELYPLLCAEAEARDVALGELLIIFAAERLGRPELGFVPRGRPGVKPGAPKETATEPVAN